MTISEKLTKIAENMQKVYNAGYNKGKAEGGGGGVALDQICFFLFDDGINGVKPYQFDEDMTWAEWCVSEYNTTGLYVSEWDTVTNGVISLWDSWNSQVIPEWTIGKYASYSMRM